MSRATTSRPAAVLKWEVLVNAADHQALCELLREDRREKGGNGLALMADYGAKELERGDRLEPSAVLPDVFDFFNQKEFPFRAVFWRRSRETLCRHRCPLFDPALGLIPRDCLAKDALHVLYLGVMNSLCKVILWMILASRVFAVVIAVLPGIAGVGCALAAVACSWP